MRAWHHRAHRPLDGHCEPCINCHLAYHCQSRGLSRNASFPGQRWWPPVFNLRTRTRRWPSGPEPRWSAHRGRRALSGRLWPAYAPGGTWPLKPPVYALARTVVAAAVQWLARLSFSSVLSPSACPSTSSPPYCSKLVPRDELQQRPPDRPAGRRGAGTGKASVTTGQYDFETVFVSCLSVVAADQRCRNFEHGALRIASRHMVQTGPRQRHRRAATTSSQTEVVRCQLLNPPLPEIGKATLCYSAKG